MLTTFRSEGGRLLACCEWWPVDDQGRWEPKGRYIWVNQLELDPDAEARSMIHDIIRAIADLTPWAVGAYWERRDKDDGRLHNFSRQRLCREREVRVNGRV